MSGHSKWSKIHRKKGVNDQKRGKIFGKIIKELTVAVRAGGSEAGANPRLRTAMLNAKSNNMPKDVMERAINKGLGGGEADYDEVTYEGYGPGGTAIMVKCLTENKNRTVSEVRHIISKHGGNLGSTGSVNYLFEKKGVIEVKKDGLTEDTLMEIALEAGAEDVTDEEDQYEVLCAPDDFENVRLALEQKSIEMISAKVSMLPQNNVELSGEQAEAMMKMLELLEDNDDIQEVYTNFDIAE